MKREKTDKKEKTDTWNALEGERSGKPRTWQRETTTKELRDPQKGSQRGGEVVRGYKYRDGMAEEKVRD